MNTTAKNVFLWIVIIVAVVVLWNFLQTVRTGDVREVNYSEFTSMVKDNKIRSYPNAPVVFTGNEVEGKYVDSALKTLRHKLLLVQLVRSVDRDPNVRGDLRLLDCETGATEDVSATAAVMSHYREAYDRFQARIQEFARQRHAGLLRLDVDADVVPQLATLFETGSLAV